MNNVKSVEDLKLIHEYLCGDRKSGEKIFAVAYPAVKKYVYHRTRGDEFSQSERDDIVAEAMVRAVERLDLYNGTSPFKNFIIGFAKNIIKEQQRKKDGELAKVNRDENVDEVITTDEVSLFGKNPLNVLIGKEKRETLTQAINMLSEEHRQVLILRLHNEMPFKQIVEYSQKSEAAIDSLYRRALKGLINNFNKIYNSATDLK